MDLSNLPEYNFINNLTKPDIYQNQLNTLKSQMPQILDDFKKYYVFFNKDPTVNEYQQIYDNIKNNLQSLNSKLFQINNSIQSDTEKINNELNVLNEEIDNEKNKNIKFKNVYGNLDNKYNASQQLIMDYKNNYNLIYLNNCALFIGSIFTTYIIYKVYKPSN